MVNKITNNKVSALVSARKGDEQVVSATELDSHIDSSVVGKYARILETTENTAMILGFTSELGDPMKVSIVIVAVIGKSD